MHFFYLAARWCSSLSSMAYNTCLHSSVLGRTDRQSDELLAKFNATLSLEDGNFGGDNNSFAIVLSRGGGRCTPTGGSSALLQYLSIQDNVQGQRNLLPLRASAHSWQDRVGRLRTWQESKCDLTKGRGQPSPDLLRSAHQALSDSPLRSTRPPDASCSSSPRRT